MFPSGVIIMETRWTPAGAAGVIGPTLYGRAQRMINPAPLWRLEARLRVPLHGSAARAFEAWVAARYGGAVTDDIAPDPARSTVPASGVAWTNGRTMTGGLGFSSATYWQTTAAADQFARQITVDNVTGLSIGRLIWIAGSMHMVAAIDGLALTITPGLRAAAPIGTSVLPSGTVTMALEGADASTMTRSAAGAADVDITMTEVLA